MPLARYLLVVHPVKYAAWALYSAQQGRQVAGR
jgi:hypothetical protein